LLFSYYPRATYAGMITYLDDQVGLIMKRIQSLGLVDTIILFSSDNGPGFNGGSILEGPETEEICKALDTTPSKIYYARSKALQAL